PPPRATVTGGPEGLVAGPSDALTVNPANFNGRMTLTPGANFDSGAVVFTGPSSVGTATATPLSFQHLGVGGSLTFADAARNDTLVYNGTAASDTFTVAGGTGAITLNNQIVV